MSSQNQLHRVFNLKVLLVLSLGHLITDIYQSALPTLLPFLKAKLSLTYAMTGLIMLISNLTSSVIQPLFGYMSDRGEKTLLLPIGCLTAAIGLSLVSVPGTYYGVLALVIVSGLGIALYHPEGYKTASFFTGDKPAGGMSVFSVGGNLGFALGPIIVVHLVNGLGLEYLPVMAVFAFLFVPVVILMWSQITAPKTAFSVTSTAASAINRGVYISLFMVIAIVVLRSWTQFGLLTFLPFYYMDVLHGDSTHAGQLVSAFLLGGVLGTLGGSVLADRMGHNLYLVLSMIASTLCFPLIFVVNGVMLYVVLTILGIVLISTFTVTIVIAQKLLPRNTGVASGLMVGFAIGTGGLGATLLGLLADRYGVLFAVQSIMLFPFLGIIMSLVFMITRRRYPSHAARII